MDTFKDELSEKVDTYLNYVVEEWVKENELAIERGLRHVEAGAQGSHKIHRGYLPRLTYSAHWIRNEHFRQAVEAYLNQEREDVESHVDAIEFNYSPFRQTDEIRNT